MLRRVAFTELPRDPQSVKLLHHANGGVVVAAVAYRAPHIIKSGNAASTSSSGLHGGPLFFTMVEMSAPNEHGLPLRVVHVRVPPPSNVVNSISLLRSPDGAEVFVVVQAAEVAIQQQQQDQVPKSVTTYVYRRQLVTANTIGARAAGNEEKGEEDDDEDEDDDDVRAANARRNGSSAEVLRVRYQRLPRTVSGAEGSLWTAAAAFSAQETSIFGHSASTVVGAAAAALLTASRTAATEGDASRPDGENQLQLWGLSGTRVSLMATCRLPALSGFAISQVLTVAGTQDVAVVRCHNSLLEVDLAAMRRACARYPHTATTNAILTRAWRLSPHDRLTACAIKDASLFAGTDDGRVLVWDYRRATTAASSSAGGEGRGVETAQPQSSGVTTKAPITGLYAPYATGFVTCDASGCVRDWCDRTELAEEDGDDTDDAAAARRGNENNNAGISDVQNEEGNGYNALMDVAGRAASAAAAAASTFPYRSRAPVEQATGEEGCVGMDGHDNFVAVVGESGRLCVYLCS